jgi:O-antigen ligase
VTVTFVIALSAFLLRRFDIMFAISYPGTEFRLSFFITMAACLVLAARAVICGDLRIDNSLLLPLCALIVASLLSVAVGSIAGTGRASSAAQFGEMMKFVVPIFLCFAIAWGGLSAADVRKLVRVLVLAAVGTSVIVGLVSIFSDWFVRTFGWTDPLWYGNASIARARVPLSGGIQSGAFLVMVFPVCLQMYYASKERRQMLFFLLSTIVIALGIVFCFSRAVLATAALTVVGMFLARSESKGRFSKGGRKWAFIILLVVAVTVLVSSVNFERLIFRGRQSRSLEIRRKGAEVALQVIAEYPLVGTSFARVYPRQVTGFVPDGYRGGGMAIIFYKGEVSPVDPHNLFLMIGAELGLLGFAAFMWLIYGVFKTLKSASASEQLPPSGKLVVSGFMWGIFAFVFQSLGSSLLLTDLRVATLFWTFVGIALAFARHSSGEFRQTDAIVGTAQ